MNTTDFTVATMKDVRRLGVLKTERHPYIYYDRSWHEQRAVAVPKSFLDADDLGKSLGIPPCFRVTAAVVTSAPNHTFYGHTDYSVDPKVRDDAWDLIRSLPMFLLASPATALKDSSVDPAPLPAWTREVSEIDCLGKIETLASFGGGFAVAVAARFGGKQFVLVLPFYAAELLFGLTVTADMKLRLGNGVECPFANYKSLFSDLYGFREDGRHRTVQEFDFTFDTLREVTGRLGAGKKNVAAFVGAMLKDAKTFPQPGSLSGIRKQWQRLLPFAEACVDDDPLAVVAYHTLAEYASRSVAGVKMSVVFNDLFAAVDGREQFVHALRTFYGGDCYNGVGRDSLTRSLKEYPAYKEYRKGVLKKQANRAFAKIQEGLENLTLDRKRHRRTREQVEAGNLPVGTFFRKSEQYFILNDNWDLWEEMFKRDHGGVAVELANEVKGRTTYEKDLMSYFFFVLYALPEYLKKHTGHKWSCVPKLVNTQDELEPPKEDGDGVARKRSALTPTVDNEARTVTVPYASLAIAGGFGTTYCYSHDYHVLTRGFSLNGYAVTKDVEEKLNGRDDYGLMYYTLTGSAQGRGYPTFLIIFERRASRGDTRVHFHRTHPFRSKDGDYNPIHHWVAGCYNWMAGNVRREHIKAQQGDLVFVRQLEFEAGVEGGKVVNALAFDHQVNQYDSHCFEVPVAFAEYTKAAKTNVLGYVRLDASTWLRHPEHDDVQIPAGTYAIHQCRSWEANPKGVWSLRID